MRAFLFLLLSPTCVLAAPADVPRIISECEVGTTKFCGTWTWNGDAFDARWTNGTVGVLHVKKFDAEGIDIERADTTGGTAGLTATYRGKRGANSVIDGTVDWNWRGMKFAGTWTGTFADTPNQVAGNPPTPTPSPLPTVPTPAPAPPVPTGHPAGSQAMARQPSNLPNCNPILGKWRPDKLDDFPIFGAVPTDVEFTEADQIANGGAVAVHYVTQWDAIAVFQGQRSDMACKVLSEHTMTCQRVSGGKSFNYTRIGKAPPEAHACAQPQCLPFVTEIGEIGRRTGVEPVLLAAIAAQETGDVAAEAGTAADSTDGHGHGLFRLDDRWTKVSWSEMGLSATERNGLYAASLLAMRLAEYDGSEMPAVSAYATGSPTGCGAKTFWPGLNKNFCYAESVFWRRALLKARGYPLECPQP
jgi:hypothetical protein